MFCHSVKMVWGRRGSLSLICMCAELYSNLVTTVQVDAHSDYLCDLSSLSNLVSWSLIGTVKPKLIVFIIPNHSHLLSLNSVDINVFL